MGVCYVAMMKFIIICAVFWVLDRALHLKDSVYVRGSDGKWRREPDQK